MPSGPPILTILIAAGEEELRALGADPAEHAAQPGDTRGGLRQAVAQRAALLDQGVRVGVQAPVIEPEHLGPEFDRACRDLVPQLPEVGFEVGHEGAGVGFGAFASQRPVGR